MAGIVNYFLEDFVPSLQSADNTVDISKLVEESSKWSPVSLSYSNKAESVMNLGATIISNLCRSFQKTKKLWKSDIEVITKIVTSSTDLPDIVARQILLVHFTRKGVDVSNFSYHVFMAEKINIKNVLSDDERKWVELAEKVIRHKQINDKIDECLVDFGQPTHDRSDLEEEEENRIKITLVENGEEELRGFVGIHELLINADHFRGKIWFFNRCNGNPEILQLLLKIDIIAIVVHEYAHLKIRKSTGDFNMQSSIVGQLNGLSPIQNEFGFYAERKIFGEQIDWFSYQIMDLEFVESFVKAIENQSSLPPGFVRGGIQRHGEMHLDGIDIEQKFTIE